MRILFCKISAMKFYKGVIPGKDEAFNGAALLRSMGKRNEYNFAPVISEDGQAYCLGFVETKSSSKGNTMNYISKIFKVVICLKMTKKLMMYW